MDSGCARIINVRRGCKNEEEKGKVVLAGESKSRGKVKIEEERKEK